ncbi:MAG: hypothetical protein JSV77_07530 [Dehalococcoidales bacterium]|nr:MAG: hypothetical protein JSV77_07530 [Dehalococcoidales bacterium]
MVKEPDSYPLLMELVKYSRFPWYWVTVVIAVVMLLVLVLVAYLDGTFGELSELSFWRNFLDGPVLTIYILVAYHFVWRLWWCSVQALQSLLPIDEGDSNRVEVDVRVPNRRWEWVALLIGAVFWLSLWQPWGESWRADLIWLSVYDMVTQMMLFGLLSLLIYSSFAGNQYLNRLSRQHLNLDIFDTGMLTPVARSSLGFALAFIGGISLSLAFQTQEDLLMWNNITVWVLLVCFTVLVFFLSMWSTHSAMAKTKRRELDIVQKHLKAASREMMEQAADGGLKRTEELSSTVTAWVNYERRIKEAPEWPFTAGIIRRLAASTLAPCGCLSDKGLLSSWC